MPCGCGLNSQHRRVYCVAAFSFVYICFCYQKSFVLKMAGSLDMIGDGFDIDDETTFLFTSESVGEGHPGTENYLAAIYFTFRNLPSVISFFFFFLFLSSASFLMISRRQIISGFAGSIFAIFTSNESVLGVAEKIGCAKNGKLPTFVALAFRNGMGYRYLNVRVNSANDVCISCENFMKFGPVTP